MTPTDEQGYRAAKAMADALNRLAIMRRRRYRFSDFPVFDLTEDEIRRSTESAMKLAQAAAINQEQPDA